MISWIYPYKSKTKKLDFIKLSTFMLQKIPPRKWRDTPQKGRKYLQIIYIVRDLENEQLLHLNNKKINNPIISE